jgi:hypothetical protein
LDLRSARHGCPIADRAAGRRHGQIARRSTR